MSLLLLFLLAQDVRYSVDTPLCGTVDPATGRYTAPASVTAAIDCLVRAVAQADSTKFDTATVTLRPPAGATTYFIFMSGGTTPLVRCGRVLVFQDGTITKTQTQAEIGSWETELSNVTIGAYNNRKYWYYDSAVWDGTVTAYAEIVWSGSGTMYNKTFRLQVDDGSFAGWADVVTIIQSTGSTLARSRSASFTLTAGRNYRLAGWIANNMETYSIFCAKVIIDSTNSPTKFEPQYFFQEPVSGGAQDTDTLYDPAEWSGGTFTYYHEGHGIADGVGDLKLEDTAGPTDITGSEITDVIERERTGTLTMPGASATIDMNVVTFSSQTGGSRIIVQVVLTAAALANKILQVNQAVKRASYY